MECPEQVQEKRQVDPLDEMLEHVKRMESIVLGLEQLKRLIGRGAAGEIIDSLIGEAESQVTNVKRLLIH